MIRDSIGRWRRKLDLDRLLSQGKLIDEMIDRQFTLIDDGHSKRPITDLIRCILLQALVDRALAVHIFYDDDDDTLRMQYCLAVPREHEGALRTEPGLPRDERRPHRAPDVDVVRPDPANARYEPVWYEMVPPPPEIRERFFKALRWNAGMKADSMEGVLRIRFHGDDLRLAVTAPWPEDFRIYRGPERPAIRPKLPRHYAELGEPAPP